MDTLNFMLKDLSLVHTCSTQLTICDTSNIFALQTKGSQHAARVSLSPQPKAAATKISVEAILVMCRSKSVLKKTATENSFHRNISWLSDARAFESQYLQLGHVGVTKITVS